MQEVYRKGFLYLILIVVVFVVCAKIWLFYEDKKTKNYYAMLTERRDKQMQDDKFRKKIEMDDAVFFELKALCLNANTKESRDKMYEKIHDDLIDIFGDDYQSKFDISLGVDKEAWGNSDYPAYWAIQLALAKRGMANMNYTMIGYRLGYGDDVEWQIKILKKIEEYMIKYHPNINPDELKLYLKPNAKTVWSDIQKKTITIQSTSDIENGYVLCKRFCQNGRRLW